MEITSLFCNTRPLFRNKILWVPCKFPVGPGAMHSFVLGSILFVTNVFMREYNYEPNTTLRCLLKSKCSTLTISIGNYFSYIYFLYGMKFRKTTMKYTRCILIWSGRHSYGSVVIIPLPCSLKVPISCSTYPIFSCTDVVLPYYLPNLSITF